MKARYIRVSTEKQKIDRQKEHTTDDEQIFIDVISGSVDFSKRKAEKKLLHQIEIGKINYISVSSIDRLGRNLFDILKSLQIFNENNVVLRVDNLDIESLIGNKQPNPVFKLIISVLSNISEMERAQCLSVKKKALE